MKLISEVFFVLSGTFIDVSQIKKKRKKLLVCRRAMINGGCWDEYKRRWEEKDRETQCVFGVTVSAFQTALFCDTKQPWRAGFSAVLPLSVVETFRRERDRKYASACILAYLLSFSFPLYYSFIALRSDLARFGWLSPIRAGPRGRASQKSLLFLLETFSPVIIVSFQIIISNNTVSYHRSDLVHRRCCFFWGYNLTLLFLL